MSRRGSLPLSEGKAKERPVDSLGLSLCEAP